MRVAVALALAGCWRSSPPAAEPVATVPDASIDAADEPEPPPVLPPVARPDPTQLCMSGVGIAGRIIAITATGGGTEIQVALAGAQNAVTPSWSATLTEASVSCQIRQVVAPRALATCPTTPDVIRAAVFVLLCAP